MLQHRAPHGSQAVCYSAIGFSGSRKSESLVEISIDHKALLRRQSQFKFLGASEPGVTFDFNIYGYTLVNI